MWFNLVNSRGFGKTYVYNSKTSCYKKFFLQICLLLDFTHVDISLAVRNFVITLFTSKSKQFRNLTDWYEKIVEKFKIRYDTYLLVYENWITEGNILLQFFTTYHKDSIQKINWFHTVVSEKFITKLELILPWKTCVACFPRNWLDQKTK